MNGSFDDQFTSRTDFNTHWEWFDDIRKHKEYLRIVELGFEEVPKEEAKRQQACTLRFRKKGTKLGEPDYFELGTTRGGAKLPRAIKRERFKLNSDGFLVPVERIIRELRYPIGKLDDLGLLVMQIRIFIEKHYGVPLQEQSHE